MNHYTQLTAFDRGRIEEMLQEHLSMRQIALKLHRSVSTISREIHRCTAINYQAEKAHAAYIRNRKNSHRKRKLDDELLRLEIINDIQEKHWSPEQIAGRISVDAGYKVISYNTIYRSIYRDNLMIKKNHGARGIARQLRHRGKTRRRRGFFEHRGKLPIPHTIHERPVEADERLRIGDWELDTIVGKTGGQVLVTLTDRKTRILKAHKAASKRTQDVMDVIEHIFLQTSSNEIKTVTPDRGKEFGANKRISDEFDVAFYFPDPHAPWQRGTNENTNGLVREYIPKGIAMENYSDDYIELMVKQINSRPRKLFGWRSANEYYLSQVFHLD